MNDYKAKIEAILTGTVAFAIAAVRPDLHNPEVKPIYKDEATASLLQLLTEATVEKLGQIKASLPDYVTDVQVGKTPKPGATEGANLMLDDIKDHFEQAIAELKGEK